MRLFAGDAVLLPPDYARIGGRQELHSYFDEILERRQARDLKITSMEERQTDGTFIDSGIYSMIISDPIGMEVQVSGDYASLVELVNEEWLITRHIWDRNPPRSPQPTVKGTAPD